MAQDCVNPTAVSAGNSAACESLPSKLANFTSQFFGEVTKTDLLPKGVSWTLGCGLETGLPTNPRGYGEGVSCYFIRLMYDEIQALRGIPGFAGAWGADGADAVSAVVAEFVQPVPGAVLDIEVVPTAALLPGLLVFIQQSGWYEILSNSGDVVLAKFIESVPGAGVSVVSGNVIVPVSPKGSPKTGKQGPAGITGDQGVTGAIGIPGQDSNINVNGSYLGLGKSDFRVAIVKSQPVEVLLGGAQVDIYLPGSGTFYIVGTTQTIPGLSAVLFLALVLFVIVDTATGNNIAAYNTLDAANAALQPGQHISQQISEVLDTTFQATPYEPRLLQTFVSTVGPRTVRLYANQDSFPDIGISASATSFNWVQIA